MDGKPVSIGRKKALALLAYVVVAGSAVSRDSLAALLWPDNDQTTARANLRRIISELGALTNGKAIRIQGDTLVGADDRTLLCDIDECKEMLVKVREHRELEDHTGPCERCKDLLNKIVDYHRAGFMSGFSLDGCAEFTTWQTMAAEQIASELDFSLEALVDEHMARGSYGAGLRHARRRLVIDDYNEAASRQLIRLHASLGQVSKAVKVFERFKSLLKQDLGTRPDEETVRLIKAVKNRDVGTSVPHDTTPAVTGNVPRPLSTFVGRSDELRVTQKALAQRQLVTISGPGGIGKTRLAAEIGARIGETFRDGAWFVDLSRIGTGELVWMHVLDGIDHKAPENTNAETALIQYLRNKNLLLILDNCEHLIDSCCDVVESITAACPRVRILATSREALNLDGELVMPLKSLDIEEARELLLDRGKDHGSLSESDAAEIEAVEEICDRLDRMPLAIELASARLRSMGLRELNARLSSSFDLLRNRSRRNAGSAQVRHATLRSVYDWSYNLLSDSEKTVLRRLSVFTGGFDRDSARAVSATSRTINIHGPPAWGHLLEPGLFPPKKPGETPMFEGDGEGEEAEDDIEVDETLLSLVEKSLLIVDETMIAGSRRFRMLETARVYALEQLLESGEEQTMRRRHLDYWVLFVEEFQVGVMGPEQIRWLNLLESFYGNVQSAFDFARGSTEKLEEACRIVGCLWNFWIMRSRQSLGVSAYNGLPQNFWDVVPPLMACKALLSATWIHAAMEDFPRATELSLRVEKIADAAGLQGTRNWGRLIAANLRGYGTEEKSLEVLAENIDFFRSSGDVFGLSQALRILAHQKRWIGQTEEGIVLLEEAVRMLRRVGNSFYLAKSLEHLCEHNVILGRYEESMHIAEEAVEIYTALRNPVDVARVGGKRAIAIAGRGDTTGAIEATRAVVDDLSKYGMSYGGVFSAGVLIFLLLCEGDLAQAEMVRSQGLELSRHLKCFDDAAAFFVMSISACHEKVHEVDDAVALYGAAIGDVEEGWHFLSPLEQGFVNSLRERLRSRAGDGRFKNLLMKGKDKGLEKTVRDLAG